LIVRKENIQSLIIRISKHDDQSAFEELFNLYFAWLKTVARAIVRNNEDAEEVVEDVFVKFWFMRDKLDQIINIETYLYTAIKNQSYNYVKKFYKGYLVELQEESDDQAYIISPEEVLIIEELKTKIESAILNLPDKCREIFTLVRQNGHSHKKAAELLNLSPKTIENQLGIAIKKIKLELDDYLNEPTDRKGKNISALVLPCFIFFF